MAKPLCFTFALVLVALSNGNAGAASRPATYSVCKNGCAFSTIAKVNALPLAAGDTVRFKGGETFDDQILVPQTGVTYTSYGTGQATLSSTGWTTVNIGHGRDGVTLSNLSITAAANAGQAIYIGGRVDDLALKNLSIASGADASTVGRVHAMAIHSSPAAPNTHVTISGCTIKGWRSGIDAAQTDSAWTVKNNTIDLTNEDGIVFNRYSPPATPPATEQIDNTVVGNTITNTGLHPAANAPAHGIYDNWRDSVVRGNIFRGFDTSGVSIRARSSTIEGNTIDGAGRGYNGIAFGDYDATNVPGTSIWSNNKISGVRESGIYVSPRDPGGDTQEHFRIANNTIAMNDTVQNSGSAKIAVAFTAGSGTIANNELTGATDYDVLLGDAAGDVTVNWSELNNALFESRWGSRYFGSSIPPAGHVQTDLDGTASVSRLTYSLMCDGGRYRYWALLPTWAPFTPCSTLVPLSITGITTVGSTPSRQSGRSPAR